MQNDGTDGMLLLKNGMLTKRLWYGADLLSVVSLSSSRPGCMKCKHLLECWLLNDEMASIYMNVK